MNERADTSERAGTRGHGVTAARNKAALTRRPVTDAPARGPASWVPGVAVCLAGALLAWLGSLVLPGVSPLLLAILLGVAWRNLAPVPAVLGPGIAVSSRRLLRTGIVLLGLQLSLTSILDLGAGVLLVVVASVAVTVFATLWFGHLLGVGLAQRLLIASGFSICGAAAVAGADGVVKARQEEVATAIALVVLYGTLMIPLVPLLGAWLGLDEEALGLWIGASTHEVAQVVAASGTVGGGALAVAVTVKLARVLTLAPVVAGISVYLRRRRAGAGTGGDGGAAAAGADPRAATNAAATNAAAARAPLVPLFVVGFIVAMLVRTAGVLPTEVLDVAQVLQAVLLAAAMFALGLGVHLKSLLRVGPRPLLLGLLATATILVVSGAGVALLGGP